VRDTTFVLHFCTGARASFFYFTFALALAQERTVVLKQQKLLFENNKKNS
jgi:hypothetical protein